MFNAFDCELKHNSDKSQQDFSVVSDKDSISFGAFSNYHLQEKNYTDSGYKHFFQEIDRLRSKNKSKLSIEKILLKERVSGKSFADLSSGFPYLESNAQTGGDCTSLSDSLSEKDYRENLVNICGKRVAWFDGETTHDRYIKQLSCRKQWCPTCGGKNGTIHKSRMHSIFKRVDVAKYVMRQFVFTIPQGCRELVKTRDGLNLLFSMVKKVIEHFFGEKILDKHGHVKKYKLKKAVIATMHIFGDPELYDNQKLTYNGIFKPHINIQILENRSENLKLEISKDMLKKIKDYWLKQIKKIKPGVQSINVYYDFKIQANKIVHALKYMCRPWSYEDYHSIKDDELKKLLTCELNGFQYLRYWGLIANCNYKDEMEIEEIQEELIHKVNEKLIFRSISDFDVKAWGSKLEKIDDGFFRVKKREWVNYESEIREKEKKIIE